MPTKQDVEDGVKWLTRAEDQHIRSQIQDTRFYFAAVRVFIAANRMSGFLVTDIRFEDDVFSLVDSLNTRNFCALLEEVFEVELTDDEHNSVNTVAELVRIFNARLALA